MTLRGTGRFSLGLATSCAALALAAGCGSSGSSTSTGSSTTSSSSASENAAGSRSTPTAKSGSKTSAAGGLKADTTPKYAKPSSSAPVQSGVVQIAYRNIAIDPDTVRVKVGTTVKWTNYDPIEHNVTSESGPIKFASKNFGEGKTFEVTMTKPGIVHYECTLQPASMNGTIEVVE
jgi:plastocyanin